MSEEVEDTVDVEALQTQLADTTKQLEAIKAKNDELLGEAKRAKNAKREAEEAAKREAEEKAKASNDYEQLHKSSESERQKLADQLEALNNKIGSEKRNNAAMKLATSIADGSNAELLAEFVSKRLKYSDDQVHVLNESGELTVSTLDDLKKEFQNDARYASLLKGNQSSGGGATGGSNGNGVAKQITRAEFDALSHTARSKFSKGGGTVTD